MQGNKNKHMFQSCSWAIRAIQYFTKCCAPAWRQRQLHCLPLWLACVLSLPQNLLKESTITSKNVNLDDKYKVSVKLQLVNFLWWFSYADIMSHNWNYWWMKSSKFATSFVMQSLRLAQSDWDCGSSLLLFYLHAPFCTCMKKERRHQLHCHNYHLAFTHIHKDTHASEQYHFIPVPTIQ